MSDDVRRFVVIETVTTRRVFHVDAVCRADAIAVVQIARGEFFREREPSPTGPRARATAAIHKRERLRTEQHWISIDLEEMESKR